jgi:hypothetical protein
MFAATKSDLAAANLLTSAREIMFAHGITFRINADKSVDFAGDDTEEMYAEIENAERAADEAARAAKAAIPVVKEDAHTLYCIEYMRSH